MPAFVGRLDDDEIRDVIAYIRTLWTDEQRASQRALTEERCAS
jgi:mono/diheme cytochrome c family protein